MNDRAGYLKIQSYVAFSQWASSHFVDPSLWGILQSSLTSFDNDLQASNAAHVPLMLVHGTEDENVSIFRAVCLYDCMLLLTCLHVQVPVWHSRELKALVDRWTGNTSSVLYVWRSCTGRAVPLFRRALTFVARPT